MASYDGSIRIDTRLDSKGFNKDAQSINNSLKSIGKAAVAAFATGAIVAFGAEVSKLATTSEGSIARVADIFGESSKAIDNFAQNNATALGLSRKAVYQYSSIYGNLFKNITSGAEQNSQVTIAMLNASAVVASKTGRTMEDVMDRIRSGLLGKVLPN